MPLVSQHSRLPLSVIIPTYNRKKILLRCLQALGDQSCPPESYEILIVDDGSSDGTADLVQEFAAGASARVRYFHQQNRKQGAARNLGLQHAEGEYVLFVGDDIFASRSLLAEHLRFHDQHNPDGLSAVLGYIRWAPDLKTTRFMRWVGEMGWQFGFSLIKDPLDLPFNFFYTSNISLSRRFLLDGGGFDEDFREYGWEDIELSFRLKDRGMTILYNKQAVADHYHPTTLASFCERQLKVGYTALCFYRKHPEMERFLGVRAVPEYSIRKHLLYRMIRRLSEWSDRYGFPDMSKYYEDLMSYYYFQGLRKALADER